MNPALPRTMSLGPVEHPDLTGYGQLKLDIASHLTKQDVTILMTFFELDRAAADAITRDEFPQLRFVEKLDMLKLIGPKDFTRLLSALDKVGLSGVGTKVKNSIDDYDRRWLKYRESKADSRKDRFLVFLRQLGLQRKKSVSLIEAMEIRRCHVDGETEANILDAFLSKITCYDHRIHRRRKVQRVRTFPGNSTLDTPDWADVDSDDDDADDNSEGTL